MPPVSVVIPAFNAEAFVGDAIQSVLAQTIGPTEIVVVDDGSSDTTIQKVRVFGERVRLIEQSNGGAALARNNGVAHSRCEWVAFLDADDLWAPEKLETQLAAASRTGAALIYSDRLNIGSRGQLPERQSDIQPLLDGDVFEALLSGNFISTSSAMIRRDVFDRAGRFSEDPGILPAEDWDLWLRVAHDHATAACRECLISYRHHLLGVSRNPARMNRARSQVITQALRLPRGSALAQTKKRQVRNQTWGTNAWDAARHGYRVESLRCYLKALAAWPWRPKTYADIARLFLNRF